MSGPGLNPDCHYGDHRYEGTSQCQDCGQRIRCWCGCFVRADRPEHYLRCRVLKRMEEDSR